MMKIVFAALLVLLLSCSKNEAPSSSASFNPVEDKKEDPLKLGTGACTVDQKKDCDTKK